MDFTIGRNDFSVTVYVPWNCTNNCPFCSSKKDYERIPSDFEALKQSLYKIRESMLPIVVFTGGEPSSNIEMLKELLAIVDNKIVYINTSLPERNAAEFINLVNSTDCIKGISVSRHRLSFKEDSRILRNIARDAVITLIKKPVRINVVQEAEDSFDISNVEKYVKRWKYIAKAKGGPESLVLNLRGNYCLQDSRDLHDMTGSKVVNELATRYYYNSHSFCNVCDTCVFEEVDENGNTEFVIQYHRGLMHTAIKFGNVIELNDLIILQNGEICYDWDGKNEGIEKFMEMIKE